MVSKDPVENAKIKVLRAYNRITRVNYGYDYIRKTIKNEKDIYIMIPTLFYYMEKF